MTPPALVIGGGPAGLMAAEVLARSGHRVLVAEAKPSLARKFLMAGKSGLNLTKAEDFDAFLAAYGDKCGHLRPMLEAFGPMDIQNWAEGLGLSLFTGATGRVFPTGMKASPLLRAWLLALGARGVFWRTCWRWLGWEGRDVVFDTPEGRRFATPGVTVLALGGASWAKLGSDGAWAPLLAAQGTKISAFRSANVGLEIAWSPHMARYFGQPVKGVSWHAGGSSSRGEAVVSTRGLEGGGIYEVVAKVRDGADLRVDLTPDVGLDTLALRLSRPRGRMSQTNYLRKFARLDRVKHAILKEFGRSLPDRPAELARLIKSLPIKHAGLRPIDEAISTAGGVCFASLSDGLELRCRPGVFLAGEMLDWEAPTGGYLLTACLSTGHWAGASAAACLDRAAVSPSGGPTPERR